MRPALAVVIPARNEAARLPSLLADLARAPQLVGEVCVVDGESEDGTTVVAQLGGAQVVRAPASRGGQLRRGVEATTAPWLLLLHADGRLPTGWALAVEEAMGRGPTCCWAFHFGVAGGGLALRFLEGLVNIRTVVWHLPYGDQGLLVARRALEEVGGVPAIPLMEDLELILRLRAVQPVQTLPGRFLVDGRRWRQLGVLRTSWRNAMLRRAWRRGVPPEQLVERYGAYQKAHRRC